MGGDILKEGWVGGCCNIEGGGGAYFYLVCIVYVVYVIYVVCGECGVCGVCGVCVVHLVQPTTLYYYIYYYSIYYYYTLLLYIHLYLPVVHVEQICHPQEKSTGRHVGFCEHDP